MRLTISSAALATIRAHVAHDPAHEVCGLLLGRDLTVTEARPTRNVASEPASRFEVDPAALFAAIRAERDGGPAMVGHYHSHPNGRAAPSPTDVAMIREVGEIWIIVAGPALTAWRAHERGGFTRLGLAPAEADRLSDPTENEPGQGATDRGMFCL